MTTEVPAEAPARRFTDRSAQSRAAILAAARARFAADGYEKTTIRAVAADAGIDASMVMRYYGSKANLFQASASVELGLPVRAGADPAALAADLASAFVTLWETGETEVERMVVRTAVTHPEAVSQMQRLFDQQIKPSIMAALGDDPDAELRAAFVMSHNLGMVLCRYLLGLEPLSSASPEVLQRAIQDTINLYLTRPL